jgi:hypothetical protein
MQIYPSHSRAEREKAGRRRTHIGRLERGTGVSDGDLVDVFQKGRLLGEISPTSALLLYIEPSGRGRWS